MTNYEFFCLLLIDLFLENIPKVIHVQGSPFKTLCLGSIELDRVISEPCYKGIILQRNTGK